MKGRRRGRPSLRTLTKPPPDRSRPSLWDEKTRTGKSSFIAPLQPSTLRWTKALKIPVLWSCVFYPHDKKKSIFSPLFTVSSRFQRPARTEAALLDLPQHESPSKGWKQQPARSVRCVSALCDITKGAVLYFLQSAANIFISMQPSVK